jgi:glycosyltransferase involved in cell wall biosynthesis
MIVGIDGNEANIEKRVGGNQYAYEILKGIAKLQDEWKSKFRFIVYLKKKPLPNLPKETEFFKYKIIPGGAAWILTKLTPHLWLSRPRPDIFFSPSHYIPPFICIPRVCSIMDLGYLKFSGQFRKKDFWQLKLWSAISICISKAIFAISNSTKMDIVRHYPFAKDKIYVTPLAFDHEQFNADIPAEDVRRVKSKYSIVSDYVLYLGTLKPSKNIEGLITAFQAVISNFPARPAGGQSPISNLKLVIAGKKGWMFNSIFQKVEELGLGDSVAFTDFVPEEDKSALVKGARLFVLPSFWEGFGLDALNAMASGVPVVASNVGSLPEVVGDAGILVDPYNINSIAKGISEVLLADEKKYNSLVQKGLAQARKFSWEKTTRETLRVFERIGK